MFTKFFIIYLSYDIKWKLKSGLIIDQEKDVSFLLNKDKTGEPAADSSCLKKDTFFHDKLSTQCQTKNTAIHENPRLDVL